MAQTQSSVVRRRHRRRRCRRPLRRCRRCRRRHHHRCRHRCAACGLEEHVRITLIFRESSVSCYLLCYSRICIFFKEFLIHNSHRGFMILKNN